MVVDRISVLPKDIIDSILTRLPILEAVRTSVVSRSWRYQWHSLSKIDINHDGMFQVSQPEFDNKIVKIIDCILLVHCGPVDKFALNINLETCYDIDRWILYVSRNGIKELTINKQVGGHYSLPSCLFSCSDLTLLKLINCIFKPSPAAFRVFGNLTELDLDGVVFSDEGLENLLNSCPLLSSLNLVAVSPPPSFVINAPNLVMLHIDTFDSYSQFKYTHMLASASFGLQNPTSSHIADCKMVELLGSLPNLQSLEFHEYAWQFYSDKYEARMSADGFWEGEHDLSFSLNHLQQVWLTDFTGVESELKVIKFLLASAPALKTMEINFEDIKDVKGLFTIVTELIRFPRASPKAELILPSYPNISG